MAEDGSGAGLGALISRVWHLAIVVWMCLAAYALYDFARFVLFTDSLARVLGGQRAAADLSIWLAGAMLLLAGIILPSVLLRRAWRRAPASRTAPETQL